MNTRYWWGNLLLNVHLVDQRGADVESFGFDCYSARLIQRWMGGDVGGSSFRLSLPFIG